MEDNHEWKLRISNEKQDLYWCRVCGCIKIMNKEIKRGKNKTRYINIEYSYPEIIKLIIDHLPW